MNQQEKYDRKGYYELRDLCGGLVARGTKEFCEARRASAANACEFGSLIMQWTILPYHI